MSKSVCLKCNKENEYGAKYCGFCGSHISNTYADSILKEGEEKLNFPGPTNKSIFESRTFWITVGILALIIGAYQLGNSDNQVLTPQDLKNNEAICLKWGGQILRDSNGQYIDCIINGQLESSY